MNQDLGSAFNISVLIIHTVCKTVCSSDSQDCVLLHFYRVHNFPQEKALPSNLGPVQAANGSCHV